MATPTIDEILGKPTVDDILGPPPVSPGETSAAKQEVRQAPGQISGPTRYLAGAGSALLHGLAVGAGLPGDLEAAGMNYLVNPLVRAFGGTPEDMSSAQTGGNTATFFPTSGQLQDYTAKAGLTNRTDLIPGRGPYPSAEVLGNAGLEGLGTAIPLAATGGPVLPQLAAGVAGGLAGEGMSRLLPGNSLAPIGAGLLGGIAGQGIVSALSPGALEREARSLGTSTTRQEAGVAIQQHAQNWLDNVLPDAEARVWSPLDSALHSETLPSGPVVDLPNFEKTLRSIVQEDAADPRKTAISAVLQPGLPRKILDTMLGRDQEIPKPNFLTPPSIRTGGTGTPSAVLPSGLRPINPPEANETIKPGGSLRPMVSAASTGTDSIAPVDWDFARQIRTMIGNGMNDVKNPLQSIGQRNLSKMYGAITQDLGEAAKTAGAGDLFSTANAESERLRSIAEKNIGPLVQPKITPETAATMALSKSTLGGTNLQVLRDQIPDAINELASAHLLQTPKGWNSLSKEAKEALVPDGAQRARIDTAVENFSAKDSSPLTRAAEKLGGMGTGEIGGVLLNALFPHVDPLTAGALGGAAGMLLPHVERAGAAAIRHPRLPLAAAAGAANALYPGPGQAQQ